MTRPSIAAIRNGLVDFQKSYEWELEFLRFPSVLGIDPFRFNIQCLATEVPKHTGDTATLMMRGHQIFDPGIYRVQGTYQLTFLETVDAEIRKLIYDWTMACKNKTGMFSELTADLRLVTKDNQGNPNYDYWMLWAYAEDSNINMLDGGTSDPMQPSLTLRYTDLKENKLV